MRHYKIVFVVLTYRNTVDIIDFLESLEKKLNDYKVLIVNSYFDNMTLTEFKKIALKYDCDFLNIPNKGYSYGNNVGISFLREKYRFDYLICSNPDIIVEKMDIVNFNTNQSIIYCGDIINKKNKKQNPMLVVENSISDFFIYKGYMFDNNLLIYLGIFINKIIRYIFLKYVNISNKKFFKIYQPHGSFIMFSYGCLEKLNSIFDDKMFLFSEEGVLAKKAKKNNIPIYFTKNIQCTHKEDGSINLFQGNISSEYKRSSIYFYENYCKTKERRK